MGSLWYPHLGLSYPALSEWKNTRGVRRDLFRVVSKSSMQADALMNGGLSVPMGMFHETLWSRGHDDRRITLMRKPTVTITITINLAHCLFGIAAILKVLL